MGNRPFNYTFTRTGRAIYYDGNKETAMEIENAIPDTVVEWDARTHIAKITKYRNDAGVSAVPIGVRTVFPGCYIVFPRGDICTPCYAMAKQDFEANLIKIENNGEIEQ